MSVISKLCPQSWKDPMTAYLAFKVAIRTENRGLASKCLDTVGSTPDHVDYLGACIAESQKVGDIFCAIAALKKLQENYEYKQPNPIHLPALFQCTIRLLQSLADTADAEKHRIVPDLCDEFDAGERTVSVDLVVTDRDSGSCSRKAKRDIQGRKALQHGRARVVQPKLLQPRSQKYD